MYLKEQLNMAGKNIEKYKINSMLLELERATSDLELLAFLASADLILTTSAYPYRKETLQ